MTSLCFSGAHRPPGHLQHPPPQLDPQRITYWWAPTHPPTGAGDHRKQSSSRCLPAKQSETVLGWSRQKRTCTFLCLTSAEISACDKPPLRSARFVTKSKTLSPSLSTAITLSLPSVPWVSPNPNHVWSSGVPLRAVAARGAGGHWSFLTACPR